MTSLATFAAGCFWCTEAIFQRLNGVTSVVSGYSGGTSGNPDYEEVVSGNTGHAEAIQITFDNKTISYETLLEVFWATHDSSILNKEGYDEGTQYRSVIFYHTEEQKSAALQKKNELLQNGGHTKIVTEIVPFTNFYPAEKYHQKFYEQNPQNRYCTLIINPKINKLLSQFGTHVKDEYK